MKKILLFALLLVAGNAPAQIPTVQKIVNGKRCDTCLVKYYAETGNTLEYIFTGGHFNSTTLNNQLVEFKNSLPKENNEQRSYVTRDSIISIAFIANDQIQKNPKAMSFLWEGGFDYNNIKVSVNLNKERITDTIPLSKLKPVKNFVINKIQYNRETGEEKLIGERDNNSIENIHLKTGDILQIVLYNTRLKATELTLNIKRVKDRPSHFVYYETPLQSIDLKQNLQSFLSVNVKKGDISFGDSTTKFLLRKGNLGVFNFNSLETAEVIEYKISGDLQWKRAQPPVISPFEESVYILIDNSDIPPGSTKDLIFRYKDLPGSEFRVTIEGTTEKAPVNWLVICGVIFLTGILFSLLYFLKRKQDREQIRKLDQKNKDIETRLSLLSGQLNPHFLFNTLHAIQGTINSNNVIEANEYISSVAIFMRTIMDYSKKEFISLKEELRIETDYLRLEQKRTSFNFNIKIEPGIETALIDFPPLLLQPVLENSIRHGFENHTAAPQLEIIVAAIRENLFITVNDNGIGWDNTVHPEGHGLSLVSKRLELLNEKASDMPVSIVVTAVPNKGTSTIFTFKNWLA